MPTSAQFIKSYFSDADVIRSNEPEENEWKGAVFCSIEGKSIQIGPVCTGVFTAWDECLKSRSFMESVITRLNKEAITKIENFFININKATMLTPPVANYNSDDLIEVKSDVENRDPFTMARDW